MRYRHLLAAMMLSAGAITASASVGNPGNEEFFICAREMYAIGNFTGAIDQAGRYLKLAPEQPSQAYSERESAELLMLKATLMHGDLDTALGLADNFVIENAGSPLVPQARWLKAETLFYDAKFADAAGIYETLPFGTFAPADANKGLYHYAVALTEAGVFDRARNIFQSLNGTEWNDEAQFYMAYIDYVSGDLDTALKRFALLPPEVAYRLGADFFVAQIHFTKGNFFEVLSLEDKLIPAARRLERGDTSHEAEAYRLLGESAYATSHKTKASYLLGKHVELHPSGGKPSARYILGVMAYDDGKYSEADEWFIPVADSNDELGQSATLYLGQSAARRGDNTSAAIYFDRAAHQPYDARVAETALYNYAAAVAGGGRVPFGSASTLLEEFGSRYPNSKYSAAVDEYLATGYMAEKRYRKALDRLDRIKHPSAEVRTLTLQTLYELGVAELAADNPGQAEYYLRRAVSTGQVNEVGLASRLWLAEALYAQKKYKEAAAAYKQYLSASPSADANRGQAYYNMAYALYQTGDYKACRSALDNALKVKGAGALSSALRTDALLRRADCDNYLGNVRDALAAYQHLAEEADGTSPDYAALQAACMQGVLGDEAAKKKGLEAMLAKYPDSPWTQQAYYELAQASLNTGDFNAAVEAQNRLQRIAPSSSLLRESKLNLAGAYQQAGRTDDAVSAYKQVIKSWPSSTQATAASGALQAIYSRRGELNSLMEFLASVPGAPQPKASELDQLTYVNAIAALEKDPLNAAPMEDYLARFPQGSYASDALLAAAEAYRASRNSENALRSLDTILSRYADSDASLPALLMKAQILSDRGKNEDAARLYNQLLKRGGATYAAEAYQGLMQTASDPAEALEYADKYLSLTSPDADERALINTLKADNLIALGRTDEALTLLKTLATDTSTPEGGAAAVKMARIYLDTGNPAQAEKLMLAFTETGCDDTDTQALGYILLADSYAAQGKKRLAYQYYESLQENYPGSNQEIITLIANGLKKYK